MRNRVPAEVPYSCCHFVISTVACDIFPLLKLEVSNLHKQALLFHRALHTNHALGYLTHPPLGLNSSEPQCVGLLMRLESLVFAFLMLQFYNLRSVADLLKIGKTPRRKVLWCPSPFIKRMRHSSPTLFCQGSSSARQIKRFSCLILGRKYNVFR